MSRTERVSSSARVQRAISSTMALFPTLSDKEIIARLLHKVSKNPVPLPPNRCNMELPTFNICGNRRPWKTYSNYTNTRVYFFSELKMNDQVSKIKAAYGTWNKYSTTRNICDNGSRVIGYMKRFKFKKLSEAAVSNDQSTKYYLKVFVLDDRFRDCVNPDCKDYVCCLLTKAYVPPSSRSSNFDVEEFLDQVLLANNDAASPDHASGDHFSGES